MTRETRKAWHQALGCGIVLGLLIAIGLMVARRPADADQLRLPIAELRSQAAELKLLRAQSAAANVTPRFARAHARQLAKVIEASREELASMRVEGPLADAKVTANALAAQVAAAADRPDAPLPIAPLQMLEAALQR